MIVQVVVEPKKIETLNHGDTKIVFTTNELEAKDQLDLFKIMNSDQCLMLLKKDMEDFNLKDIPELPVKEFEGQKSKSQLQRNAIYVLWEKKGKKGDFETFYNSSMEAIREQIKEKIKFYDDQTTMPDSQSS